ncbi:MFS transporter [Rugosimonospora africana]|uniref:MFS transporter n=1 Tax=Rugosimonospora africana TaxID=556532 RepID=A0A8J3QNB2_9ACTN|nr:MFS transporter [Rugosimonospora africana]GIH14205.1 MFS transporter [Rugosimonospora africana]
MSTETVAPAQTRAPALDPGRWLALGVIALAQLLIVLDASIVNIALPTAQHDLHISDANRQWVVTAYTLAFGGLLLLGGRIADFTGRKRAFIIGLIGFAAASAIGGGAVNEGMLFIARGAQGAFAALMAPAALSLLTVTFTDARERARAFGVYGAIAGGGLAVGLLAGGVLTEYLSWRWCLLVSAPVAIVAAILALRFVHESRAEGNTRYDIPGALTSTVGFVALVYGFTKASSDGWTSATTLSLLIGAAVLLAAFVVIELRSKHPLLPMRVILDNNRGGSYLAALLVGVGMFGVFLFLTYYMQITLGYSALMTGVAFLPFTVGIILGAGLSTQLLTRVGPRVSMVIGLTLAAVGMALLTRIGVDTGYWSHVLPAVLVISFGMGITFGPLSNTALVGVANHDAGVASALVNTAQQIGGSLGTALLNTIAASALTSYLADHAKSGSPAQVLAVGTVHSYTVAFWVSAGLIALAAVITAVLVRARRDQLSATEGAPAAF